jgi:Glycosyl transferases group 1
VEITQTVRRLSPVLRGESCRFGSLLSRCALCHCPHARGTGISIKAVEALALGKPFVGTSAAFRGLPMDRLKKAGIRTYDDAEGFAEAISRTLSAEWKAISISRAAYEDVFSIRASFSARDMALQAAGIGIRSSRRASEKSAKKPAMTGIANRKGTERGGGRRTNPEASVGP